MRRSSRHAPARTLIESLEDLFPSINEEQFCVADSQLVLAARTSCDQQVQGTYHERPLFALAYADGGAHVRTGRGRCLTFLCAAASRRYSSAEEGVELLTIDAAGGHWNGADG